MMLLGRCLAAVLQVLRNDEFCIASDEFCINIMGFAFKMMIVVQAGPVSNRSYPARPDAGRRAASEIRAAFICLLSS